MKTIIFIAAIAVATAWTDGYLKGQVHAEQRIIDNGDLITQLQLADARTQTVGR